MSILFILESPGKVAKVSSFLGKKYIVKASVGHIRDLDPKKMSIDFDNNFEPIYVITKPDVVKNLKFAMKNVDMVYIAADFDVEGSQISQSLYDVLRPKNYKRLIFNEITKKAIMKAIENPGLIDKNLVDAQKTRRVLDRLYGYLISPILQRQIGGNLSAGRVQSVAVEIIIDKENEIKTFLEKNSDSTFFKVNGLFSKFKAILYNSTDKKPYDIKTVYHGKVAQILLVDSDNPDANVVSFLNKCLKSKFIVHSVSDRIALRTPAPPFTTSTLQQEANRKFGMPIDLTMKTAQKLYEAGYITYMRTDSVEISEDAQKEIKKVIEKEYGNEYYQKNNYKSKITNAQNAHEAIRPVHAELMDLKDKMSDSTEAKNQIKLYRLIWQRTIASQMKPAKINVTTVQISISKYSEKKIEPYYFFNSQIEKIIFQGFMKVYVESVDDAQEDETMLDFNGKIPIIGDVLSMEQIVAKQEYLKPPPRYGEASFVKKLENIGIGRPSTYVNTIKTIMNRDYIKIANIPGTKKDITTYTISSDKNKYHIMEINKNSSTILLGKENNKIIPTALGTTVNNFLLNHFPEMMDYKFTANMETEMDEIANGNKIWHKVVRKFYNKLIPIIEELKKEKSIPIFTDRLLGTDANGNEIFAAKTKFGPRVKKQIGSKFYYAEIKDPLELDTIKLKDAIKLLQYPIILGQYNGEDVLLKKGETNFFLQRNKQTYSLDLEIKDNISIKDAIQIIEEKKASHFAEFEITEGKNKVKAIVLDGKFGPYIMVNRAKKRTNYKLDKSIDPTTITKSQVMQIISQKKEYGSKNSTKTIANSKVVTKK